ncbi:farnesyl pyrophosphate synthase isoform X1 [Thamnophis elegans]|uniref:farnesyl pyrophosphate synthase isoform X1 n=2 Tax=Thamnophis elegans TaxID=35005 RepID=UPI00137902BE|nr:farnesyl pyrophosphate synthase isoform X1 [Thamnophis elegans]
MLLSSQVGLSQSAFIILLSKLKVDFCFSREDAGSKALPGIPPSPFIFIGALQGFWRERCEAAIDRERRLPLPGRVVFLHLRKAGSFPIFFPARKGLLAWKTMSESGKHHSAVTDKEEFVNFFSQIVRDLLENELHVPELSDAVNRLKRVIEYNAVGGKYNRGLTVVAAVRELAKPDQPDPKTFRIALVVGWCVELLQAFFLITDDIMDSSLTRRGRPCWYRQEGIGLDAVNDGLLIESSVYQLLKRYCRDQPYYLNLMELFLQSSYQTELGQTLDLFQIDLDSFTEKRYKAIVKHKTAYYSFYLPVAAAMYMAGIDSEEEHAHAKAILLEMGEFFQIQDDFLDNFGDPQVTGKIGTDIQDNKCSWLVVQSLKQASREQRKILEENYGKKDPEKINRVKALYEEQDLKAVYQSYEENSYQKIVALIDQHAVRLPARIFLDLADKIYKRQK